MTDAQRTDRRLPSRLEVPVSAMSSRPDLLDLDVLRTLFANAPVALTVVDVRTRVVCYANPATRFVTGRSADDANNRPLGEVFAPAIASRAQELLAEIARTNTSVSDVEVDNEIAPDDHRHLSLSAWPVHAGEQSSEYAVLQIEEITDDVRERRLRVAMAEQLQGINEHLVIAAMREQELTQMAEAANDAKSVFLAMMSHELRTPLTAIMGYEELLADGLSGPVTPDQRVALERIRHSANHLLALIEQVLTLANIELKREVVVQERFTLGQLVRSVQVLVAPLASEKRLAFEVDVDDEEAILESDPLRLKQILVNLLRNAVRFTDHGAVLLRVRRVADALWFEVRDSGIGIRDDDLEKIFDPFWQVEQRPIRKVGGSGLGLTVARRTARLLGGDIDVESSVGEGSVFTLRIPSAA